MKKFPILFPADSMTFTTNGIGVLSDAVSCKVTEELNGEYELEMQYPVSGNYFKEIKEREIIYAKPNVSDNMQPFRIYRISSPMNGNVKIYAEHISYDLNGIQVSPFEAINVVDAMEKIKSYSVTDNPFTFTTNKATVADMKIKTPRSARNCLCGQENSLLDIYKGNFKFDGYTVSLLSQRGEDTGMSIRYGVNLTDIKQDKNISKIYTGIYPYYYSEEDGKLVELPEKILIAEGDFGFTRIASLDLTSYFENEPTVDELRKRANQYLRNNLKTEPDIDITVKFEQLRQYEEYKDIAFLELLSLGDTVKVIFPKLNISASARCIKTIYDAILQKYISVTLGNYRSKITSTITILENVVIQHESKIRDQGRTIARLEISSDEYGAQISSITEWIGDSSSGATQTIAQLSQKVDSQSAQISSITEWIGDSSSGATLSIAKLQQESDSQGAKIGLLVQTDSSGNNSVKGSVIIEAINGESTATISADRVNLSGYVTISNLENGTTVVDGSCIKTGKVSAEYIDANGIVAENVDISGKVTAISGYIGGWSIGSNKLSSAYNTQYEFNIDASSSSPWISASAFGTTKFRVSKEGVLYATGADIAGKITSTSGKIGKLEISSAGINYSPATSASNKVIIEHSDTGVPDSVYIDFAVAGAGTERAELEMKCGDDGIAGAYMSGKWYYIGNDGAEHNLIDLLESIRNS